MPLTPYAGVFYFEIDGAGNILDTNGGTATSGMVTILSAASEGAYAGNVDVLLDGGEPLKFGFDALCARPFRMPWAARVLGRR